MKRVVVTGGSGFIGRETLAPLRERGFEVHRLDRSTGFDLLRDDPTPVLAEIAPTHLLHLAWYAVPGKFWEAPENLDWVAASLRLARAFAAAGGKRITVAGSCAEYDWSGDHLDEAATPLCPATLYGTAKAVLFDLVTAAAPALGVSLGWGRVFFPYGPFEQAGRLLPDVIDGVRAGNRVPCSDGTQRRDFVHVEDVAAALVALLDSPVEGAINIASGTAVPVRKVVAAAAALAGDTSLIDFGARPRQQGEPAVMTAATARLSDEVGFHPRWSLAHGLADTVARRPRRLL